MRLFSLAALVVALAVPVRAQGLALELFSGTDREAVAVGDTLAVTVEVLAAPGTPAEAAALADALAAWDPAGQLGPGLAVVGSETDGAITDGVIEWRRVLRVRVLSAAVAGVPAFRLRVALDADTVTAATRPHAVQTYAASAAAGRAARSVVAVRVEGEIGGVPFERVGSAFAVGGDALVTAYHVVVGAQRVRARMPDGEWADVEGAWALDPDRDVAVLHLDGDAARRSGLAPLVVAPAGAGGDVAFTAGWPRTAGRAQRPTAARRHADLDLGGQRLRVSANAVAPGDSGGPLLDAAGRVLGVVTSGRGELGDPDLLRQTICLAADLAPALGRYRAAAGPVALDRALAGALDRPAGRAHAAVGALALAASRPSADRAGPVGVLRQTLRGADDAALLSLAAAALDDAGDPLAAGALDAAWRAGSVPAGYAFGHHLLARGQARLAADVFAGAAADGAYRRLAAFGQAQALVAQGRYDDAEGPLAAVLDHDARFAPALLLLGVVRLAQGRDAQARALVVRLAGRPEWAAALRQAVEADALRPPALRPLPRVALR